METNHDFYEYQDSTANYFKVEPYGGGQRFNNVPLDVLFEHPQNLNEQEEIYNEYN